MSSIGNRFEPSDKVKVKWCHSKRTECGSISGGGPAALAPRIGGNEGHLILQALDSANQPIESSITLFPSSPNDVSFIPKDHNLILSYDKDKFEWKIEAEEAEKIGNEGGPGNEKQINVNVEIGPKIQ